MGIAPLEFIDQWESRETQINNHTRELAVELCVVPSAGVSVALGTESLVSGLSRL